MDINRIQKAYVGNLTNEMKELDKSNYPLYTCVSDPIQLGEEVIRAISLRAYAVYFIPQDKVCVANTTREFASIDNAVNKLIDMFEEAKSLNDLHEMTSVYNDEFKGRKVEVFIYPNGNVDAFGENENDKVALPKNLISFFNRNHARFFTAGWKEPVYVCYDNFDKESLVAIIMPTIMPVDFYRQTSIHA